MSIPFSVKSNDMYKMLTKTTNIGHMNIPLCYAADPQLGRWVYQQRVNYMKKLTGKGLSLIAKKRLDRLQEIGFGFYLDESSVPLKRDRRYDKIDFSNNLQKK